MRRRTLLKRSAAAVVATSVSDVAVAQSSEGELTPETVAQNALAASRDIPETDRKERYEDCASALCEVARFREETINQLEQGADSGENAIRRARLIVGILDEQGITTAVEPRHLRYAREGFSESVEFVPMLASCNSLLTASCALSDEEEGAEEQFVNALVALVLEVALWYFGAPYKMAWRGTRFASNRTLLRFARHGCNRCVAFAMSEIHWALRGEVFEVVDEGTVEYVTTRMSELEQKSETIDLVEGEGSYGETVDLPTSTSEIEEILLGSRRGGGAPVIAEREGPFDRLAPDISPSDFISELDLSDIEVSDLLPF